MSAENVIIGRADFNEAARVKILLREKHLWNEEYMGMQGFINHPDYHLQRAGRYLRENALGVLGALFFVHQIYSAESQISTAFEITAAKIGNIASGLQHTRMDAFAFVQGIQGQTFINR